MVAQFKLTKSSFVFDIKLNFLYERKKKLSSSVYDFPFIFF